MFFVEQQQAAFEQLAEVEAGLLRQRPFGVRLEALVGLALGRGAGGRGRKKQKFGNAHQQRTPEIGVVAEVGEDGAGRGAGEGQLHRALPTEVGPGGQIEVVFDARRPDDDRAGRGALVDAPALVGPGTGVVVVGKGHPGGAQITFPANHEQAQECESQHPGFEKSICSHGSSAVSGTRPGGSKRIVKCITSLLVFYNLLRPDVACSFCIRNPCKVVGCTFTPCFAVFCLSHPAEHGVFDAAEQGLKWLS